MENKIGMDKIRLAEKDLFLVNSFSKEIALFPNKVFAKEWSYTYFLTFNDWFHNEKDYCAFQKFLRSIGSSYFISSTPPIYNIPPIKINVNSSVSQYNDEHTMMLSSDTQLKGIGLRISPEVFYFDHSNKWAILADLTHNLTICGMDEPIVSHFKDAFPKVQTAIDVVHDLEKYHQDELQQSTIILDNYALFPRL